VSLAKKMSLLFQRNVAKFFLIAAAWIALCRQSLIMKACICIMLPVFGPCYPINKRRVVLFRKDKIIRVFGFQVINQTPI
jgi:hypothetical protein